MEAEKMRFIVERKIIYKKKMYLRIIFQYANLHVLNNHTLLYAWHMIFSILKYCKSVRLRSKNSNHVMTNIKTINYTKTNQLQTKNF